MHTPGLSLEEALAADLMKSKRVKSEAGLTD
jgi:hypothetical protein